MKFITRLLLFVALLGSYSSFALPVANFTPNVISGCPPLVVLFTNTSTGSTSWKWEFNNGDAPAYLHDASTTFLNPFNYTLTYTVTLTAYNGTDSNKHSVVISVYPLPLVRFSASPTNVCPGAPVTFTSTSIGGVPGPVTCTWNYGDGFGGTGNPITHSFLSPGNYSISLFATNANGCHDDTTITSYIHVYNGPSPSFTLPVSTFCGSPAAATFASAVGGTGPFTYSWTFGDGGTGVGATPTHNYATGGTYTVKLIVTDSHGCQDSMILPITITIFPPITASFTGPDSGCVNAPVTFTNTSTTYVTNTWTFGDGHTSGGGGTNVYSTPGTYTVKLVITNGPCRDSVTRSIYIRPGPAGTFTQNPIHPCPPPVGITFTGTVPAGCTVSWVYGDGFTGSGTTTLHNYATRGIYDIDMIILDPRTGCKDTVSRRDTLYDLYLQVIDTPDSGCAPLTVHFWDSLYTFMPPPTTVRKAYPWGISSWSWSFGDGGTSTSSSPYHTYTDTGTYWAVLTVVTANGCTVKDSVKVKVGRPPVMSVSATTHVCFGSGISYTDSLLVGPASWYVWYWGDGTFDTTSLSTIIHTDTMPGIHTVTVTPYWNGCQGTPYTLTVQIDSPKAGLHDSVYCSPANTVAFWDRSYGDDSHLWIFGDGSTSTARNPVHTYPTTGIYTILLTTYNARSGCRDTIAVSVNLNHPTLDFTAGDNTLCYGVRDTFTSTVTGGSATSYAWYVNGTLVSSLPTFGYLFPDSGRYTIKLVIQDQNHCWDTLIRANYVTVARPICNFTLTPSSGCMPLPVTVVDASHDVTGVSFTNYKWSMGDGYAVSGLTTTVTHTYTTPGVFTVKEVITDSYGCKDSLTRNDTVILPNASFTSSTIHPCPGAPVTFTNTSTGYTTSAWTFGDGATSTVNSPVHSYSSAGTYTVKLVVTDSHGCSATLIDTALIDIIIPHAAFTVDDSFAICPPLNCTFTNTSTGAVFYNWWLGDGTTSTTVSPSDFYIAVGVYSVTLVAYNIYGCSDTARKPVQIFGYDGAFTYDPDTGCAPLTVHFRATLSNVPKIVWDFSDGSVDSSAYTDTITHIYRLPGAYVPRLIISDNTGCASASVGIDTIKVDGVVPGFRTIPDPICQGGVVNFHDTSTAYWGTINAWSWTFTNGDTSSLQNPTYTYTAVGTYSVVMTVTDSWGCTGMDTQNITVYAPEQITVTGDTVVCKGDSAVLTGHGGFQYWWAPATGVGCSPCNPTHVAPGTYTTYTVTGKDRHGCFNTDTVSVGIALYTQSRAAGDTEVCAGVTVHLHDSGGTNYTWLPATGLSSAIIADPLCNLQATTRYMVIAKLASCLPDTNYVTVLIHPLPTVDAGPDQTIIAGESAQIRATGTNIFSQYWMNSGTLSCDSCLDPLATPVVTTTYDIFVKSKFGCRNSDSVTIHLICDNNQIFVPNSFTPNGDGQNDVFYPRGKGLSIIKTFRIYNRWGQLLFERDNIQANDVANAWDGSYQGDKPRPDVYVYVIEALCELGDKIFIKGDVTIIR